MAEFENRAFQVEGLDELLQNMGDLQEEIGKKKTDKLWRKVMGYAMLPVLDSAKNLAPVHTGQMKDHIYMKVQRVTSRDKASISYKGEDIMARVTVSPKRRDDTVKDVVTKRGKQKIIYNYKPVALAQEFGTAEVAPKPFMRPALATNVDNVVQRLGDAVWYELQWGKWAKKG